MAHAIVLSKDRAAQLHLCLESLIRDGSHIFPNISVIYHTSNEDFLKGYEITKKAFPYISWIQQDDYYQNVLELVDEAFTLTSFFTDDDILYRNIPISHINLLSVFEELEGILGTLSLRLGRNTYVQDPYNNINVVEPTSGFHYIENNKIFAWRWDHCPSYGNFGYPLSVDGHIFRTGEIKRILNECRFKNPNQQEVAIQPYMNLIPAMMAAFEQSVVINTPLNRVQETCLNRAGETFGQSAEEMNKLYLDGNRLDFKSIDFSNIIGCHQELKINWTMK
jgi:hypothetical protein